MASKYGHTIPLQQRLFIGRFDDVAGEVLTAILTFPEVVAMQMSHNGGMCFSDVAKGILNLVTDSKNRLLPCDDISISIVPEEIHAMDYQEQQEALKKLLDDA